MQVLAHIDDIMGLESELPSLVEVRLLLATHEKGEQFFVADTRISTAYGSMFRAELSRDTYFNEVEVVEYEELGDNFC